MTLQEMRDWVRLYLDLDEEDLPDEIFDQFAEDAVEKILEREPYWPWLDVVVDFEPTIGQTTYDLATVAPNLEFVTAVSPLDTSLYHAYEWSAFADLERYGQVSVPRAWTTFANQLYIVPAPLTTDTIRITGIQRVAGWTTNGPASTPPVPDQFHTLVRTWCLAMTYAQQDDPENSMMHQAQFAERLEGIWRRWMTEPHAAGLVVGSTPKRATVSGPVWPAGF